MPEQARDQEALNRTLDATIEKMPSLPTTVGKVIQLANDINSSAKDILAVIQLDPVLTAKVLKLIHSAFYGMPNKVSLKQAVVLLGINTIKNLALSSAIVGQMGKNAVKIKSFDQHKYWEHCLAAGIASRLICKRMNVEAQTVDEFFVAGLVHDIGKLVLALGMPSHYAKTLRYASEHELSGIKSETEVIGIDHADVGSRLARKWTLNEMLVTAIQRHHDPDENLDRLTWVVHIANYLVTRKGYRNAGEFSAPRLADNAYEKIGLEEKEVEDSLSNLPEEIEKASVFLQT